MDLEEPVELRRRLLSFRARRRVEVVWWYELSLPESESYEDKESSMRESASESVIMLSLSLEEGEAARPRLRELIVAGVVFAVINSLLLPVLMEEARSFSP